MRGRPKLKIGIKELPLLINEKIQNPNISFGELRSKYGNLRVLNTSHCLDICITRINHPEYNLQQIGDLFTLSRENIRLILKQMKLPTKHKSFNPKNIIICPKCGMRKSPRAKLCKKCRNELYYEFVSCEVCQMPIRRRIQYTFYMKLQKGYQHTFCSKKCQGIWLANNYGFKRIHNYQLIGKLYSKGLKYKEISKITGTKETSIGAILKQLKKSGEINPRINIQS